MDTGILPDKTKYSMVFDSVPWEPSGLSWFSSRHLDIWLTFGPDPALGVLHLLELDGNTRSNKGVIAVAPQQIQWKP